MYKQQKKRKILCVFAHGKLKNARLPHAAKSEMQDLTRPSTHAQPTTWALWEGCFFFVGMNHLFIHFISFHFISIQFNSIHSISFIQLLSNYCTLRLPPPQKLNSHRQCFMSFDWRMVDYRDMYIIYLTINIAYTIPVYIYVYIHIPVYIYTT